MKRLYRIVRNEISRSLAGQSENQVSPQQRAADVATNARRTLVGRGVRPLALEQRFMFDGAAIADAADVTHATADAAHALADTAARFDGPAPVQIRPAQPDENAGRKEVAFVDTSLANYQSLEAGIRAGMEIVEIDGRFGGLSQLAQWAQNRSSYDAIHIYSHGSEASLRLGQDTLTTSRLNDSTVRSELATLGHALKTGGDLLLYGCDVAAGSSGQQFIQALHEATGADVAASLDATGNATLGGNWQLERATGEIQAGVAGSSGYSYLLGDVPTGSGVTTGTLGTDYFVLVDANNDDDWAVYTARSASNSLNNPNIEDSIDSVIKIDNFQAATDKLLFTNFPITISPSFAFEKDATFRSYDSPFRTANRNSDIVIVTPSYYNLSAGKSSTTLYSAAGGNISGTMVVI